MVANGAVRVTTCGIRFFQLLFAIILVGALSYMVDQFRDFGFGGVPREVVTPEVFSVLAIPFTAFSILAVLSLDNTGQIIATFLDFTLFVGYVTSAGLLRHNFHRHSGENPLRASLNNIRTARGIDGREDRNGGLVRLVSALVLIQLFLYFITTVLSIFIVSKSASSSGNAPAHEKHSRFSFSRSSRGSGEGPAAPASTV
ncbi:unnamed protein product [Tuber aestivum]|uniref:MARVEL domain-containing protein n=1 Tax=Tuber aestivum TaxID=59557 RepID=A0A292Q8R2_9PEZI|nr:unnamed protein product [Tuber aestivum]